MSETYKSICPPLSSLKKLADSSDDLKVRTPGIGIRGIYRIF